MIRTEPAAAGAAPRRGATTGHAFGDAPDVLASIRNRAINLAVWRRRLPLAVRRFAQAMASCDEGALCGDLTPAELPRALAAAVERLRLADQPGAAAWRADVADLAVRFAALAGTRRIHCHLEVVTGPACRLFHVDMVDLRLITAYRGAGTQWLRDRDVRRDALGKGDNAAVLRAGAMPQRLAPGWVGVFKGERSPSMAGRGIVHRSPSADPRARRRLVLKIDVAGTIGA